MSGGIFLAISLKRAYLHSRIWRSRTSRYVLRVIALNVIVARSAKKPQPRRVNWTIARSQLGCKLY
ncbi:hypothetical protein [Microcoleus sp. CAWBG58]|uniref:hypothetical protein n=1 Tax=Microcoleus sp. CAWBG58 TaxID=2841651 RepID=UPI0025EF3BF3|nr:hypothetical protein [Microcoleus sp. CAWBG58]